MKLKPAIRSIILIVCLFPGNPVWNQYVPTHISNKGIYDFLDELANQQIIDLYTSIKPYSRSLILEKLNEASQVKNDLSGRQLKELEFYLKDYSKDKIYCKGLFDTRTTCLWFNKDPNHRLDLFSCRDSAFRISVNPILGANTWKNSNGTFYHWWNGIETYATYGNFALFASLRDNHESVGLTNRDLMNQRTGGANIKEFSDGKRDYEEMRAGMSYSWNWGHLGLILDQVSWGDACNGPNILSGRTPPYAKIDLQLDPVDWLQFNYIHGWLVSEVVDSSLSFWINNSYGPEYREVYHSKFLAANMFTFKPFKYFYIGIGNSVIYDNRTPHAAFLIPVMFWKALDHTLSSRNLKGFHFYGSAFIDEIQVGRIFREGEYNFSSFKSGASWSPFPNINLQFEYTWSNALIFRHYVTTTTFESNQYNLGHFLEDNAKDLYTAINIKPIRTLNVSIYYNRSLKGPDHTLLGTSPRAEITPFEPVVWESTRIGILTNTQLINDLYMRLGYEWRNVSGESQWVEMWTTEVYQGITGTLNFGLNYGF